jgi:Ca2+/H+ antiporter
MTTSWAHFTHGQLSDALRVSATGTLLAGVALAVGVAASVVAVRGRRVTWQPRETQVAVAALALAGVILFEWVVRLLRG